MNRPVLLGLLALLLLCLLCLWCGAPRIEADLRDRSLDCLAGAEVPADALAVSGRDVTLANATVTRAAHDELAACLARIRGVRAVDDRLTVETPGTLGIDTRVDGITFSGTVPSAAARASLIDAASALWGADRTHDRLDLDPARTFEAWPASWASTLSALHRFRADLDLELHGGRATVAGTVVSELARERVLGAAAEALPGYEIVDRLVVGEPESAADALQATLDQSLRGKVIEFASDSADLTPQGLVVLDQVAAILEAHPGGRVEVSGHTDSQAAPEHNLDLSRRRAEAVTRYLVQEGLDGSRLEAVGFGETRPIASNATEEGRQQNRRTEFHVLREE